MSKFTLSQVHKLGKTQVFHLNRSYMSMSPKDKYKDGSYSKPKGIRVPGFVWYVFYLIEFAKETRRNK